MVGFRPWSSRMAIRNQVIAARDVGTSLQIELPTCQFCGSKFERIPDAVEMAVHKVMKAGGDVEVLQHEHKVDGFTNIGALLRY